MPKYKIKILEKEYIFLTDFSEQEVKKLQKQIEEKISYYQSLYPNSDLIDLLVIYIFELLEILQKQKQEVEKYKQLIEETRKKIEKMEKKIKERVDILTKEA